MPTQLHRYPLLALVLISSMVITSFYPGTIQAQSRPIDPAAVAITATDLSEGYQIAPEQTKSEPIGNIGVSHTVAVMLDPTPENLAERPVRIWQTVARIDRDVSPGEFFATFRDEFISNQKMGPYPGGENGSASVHLIGQIQAEGVEHEVFGAGRVRDNFVWFTLVGGASPATSIQSAIEINAISLAKYDRIRAIQGPRALVDKLFETPFPTEELPAGFQAGNIVQSEPSQRAAAHSALAEVDLQVQGSGAENLITYIIYPTEADATAAFDEAPQRAADLGSEIVTPDGYDMPVICAMRSGEIDGRKLGATSCLARLGNVEVSAFSVLENTETGHMPDALKLMEAGIKHLQKVSE